MELTISLFNLLILHPKTNVGAQLQKKKKEKLQST